MKINNQITPKTFFTPLFLFFFAFIGLTNVNAGELKSSPSNFGEYVLLNYSNFESKLSVWNKVGIKLKSNKKDASYSNSGEQCLKIKNSGLKGSYETKAFDLTNYAAVNIDFSFITKNIDSTDEYFELLVSYDDGINYSSVKKWHKGKDFENDERNFAYADIYGEFTNTVVFKVKSIGKGKSECIYLDDISIFALQKEELVIDNAITRN